MRAPTCRSATAVVAAIDRDGGRGGVLAHRRRDRRSGPTPRVPDPDRSYGYVDDRCGLLRRQLDPGDCSAPISWCEPFSGAVCQYVLSTDAGVIDVVFSWFERAASTGNATLPPTGARAGTDKDGGERHQAFLARRDTPNACAATAAAGPAC